MGGDCTKAFSTPSPGAGRTCTLTVSENLTRRGPPSLDLLPGESLLRDTVASPAPSTATNGRSTSIFVSSVPAALMTAGGEVGVG